MPSGELLVKGQVKGHLTDLHWLLKCHQHLLEITFKAQTQSRQVVQISCYVLTLWLTSVYRDNDYIQLPQDLVRYPIHSPDT